jgi:hypothetical protein
VSPNLVQIGSLLDRVEHLASQLQADPDQYVHRSALELKAAFDHREAIEPALARMRASVRMLRRENYDGCRREFRRRASSLNHLDEVVERELLPHLRQAGFEV